MSHHHIICLEHTTVRAGKYHVGHSKFHSQLVPFKNNELEQMNSELSVGGHLQVVYIYSNVRLYHV